MPGYTHLQRGQPVTLGHHLLAWVEMLDRDRTRFAAAAEAAGREPSRRRRARRVDARDRPAHVPDAELDRRGVRPRLRARLPLRGGDARAAPLADRRGDRPLVDRRVRLRATPRERVDGVVDDAAEAEPRRRRARPRQGRDGDRPPCRAPRDGEGAPARVRPRPPGGQAARVRRAPRRPGLAPGDDRPRQRPRRDRERLAEAAADPLLLATDVAEDLVRGGVPFREAHEQVAASVRDGTFSRARRPRKASPPAPHPAPAACATPSPPRESASARAADDLAVPAIADETERGV